MRVPGFFVTTLPSAAADACHAGKADRSDDFGLRTGAPKLKSF
jgi:hypothetical protein